MQVTWRSINFMMQVHRNVNITPPTPPPTLTWRSINFMMQVHRNVNITPPTPPPTLTWRSINFMMQVHMNVNITPPTPPPTLTWRSINFMMQVHMNVNITPPTHTQPRLWGSINLMSCQHHAYDFIRGKAKTCIFHGAVPTTWAKTTLATLISLNLKPLKPAIAIQLPKIIWYFLSYNFRRYQSYLYKNSTKTSKINQPPKREPKNHLLDPTRFGFPLPPNLKLLPLVLPFALRFLDGCLWRRGGFLTKKNGRHLGFSKANSFSYGWLSIGWWINQIFTLKKWLDVSPNIHLKKWLFRVPGRSLVNASEGVNLEGIFLLEGVSCHFSWKCWGGWKKDEFDAFK